MSTALGPADGDPIRRRPAARPPAARTNVSGLVLALPIVLFLALGIRAYHDATGKNLLPVGLLPPDAQLDLAATNLEDATRAGGAGFTFTVVSRSTLEAKAGGPLIDIPDPADRRKSLGLTDSYYLGATLAEGSVTPDGYWLQMRRGPDAPDTAPDFEHAPITLAALVADGVTWRNDGTGWYQTDRPPGIGLDPRTIALLPTLLRDATDAKSDGTKVVDGTPAIGVEATGEMAKAPGLLAIDAEAFSVLVAPIEFSLDGAGRLIELHAVLRNTRMTTYDLPGTSSSARPGRGRRARRLGRACRASRGTSRLRGSLLVGPLFAHGMRWQDYAAPPLRGAIHRHEHRSGRLAQGRETPVGGFAPVTVRWDVSQSRLPVIRRYTSGLNRRQSTRSRTCDLCAPIATSR